MGRNKKISKKISDKFIIEILNDHVDRNKFFTKKLNMINENLELLQALGGDTEEFIKEMDEINSYGKRLENNNDEIEQVLDVLELPAERLEKKINSLTF